MKPLGIALCSLLSIASCCSGRETPFHFEADIAPYFARLGCAAAECHGGATGRGGFKLSLFATNARADYEAITQHLGGRRIDLVQPAKSLLLRKPTKATKHGGGRVFKADSETYRALEEWIRGGAHFAQGEVGELSELKLAMQSTGEGKRAVLRALFRKSDGVGYSREVSKLARFESTNDRVASIDSNGLVTRHAPGEAWIIARYGRMAARFPVLQPFGQGASPTGVSTENSIAHVRGFEWKKKLGALGIEPAPPADQFRLLRRLYLDLAGRPPAPDEIVAFLKDPPSARVSKTVEQLLDREEFSDQLARLLWSWFEIPSPEEDLKHTSERNARLRKQVRDFADTDQGLLGFASSMFVEDGPKEFIDRFSDPRDRAEFVGRAHHGISLGCARCHNHPTDRWSQAEHLQFSALFADRRPASKEESSMSSGKFFLPGDGKPVEPVLLALAGAAKPVAERDHGWQLAEFLEEDGAASFARNAVNRVFGHFLGKHLVEAVDDHRFTNPSIHEDYLVALGKIFQDGGYDMRHLVQWIVASPIYEMDSSPPNADTLSGDAQLRYLARREARAMTSGQYARAVTSVLGVEAPAQSDTRTPLAHQLHLLNSGRLQQWLRTPGNQVDAIFQFESDPVVQLEQLYLLVLTRNPREEERTVFIPALAGASDPLAVGRDLAFALLASREFSSIR